MSWIVDDLEVSLVDSDIQASTIIRYKDDFSGRIIASRTISTSVSASETNPKTLITSQLRPQVAKAKVELLKEVAAKQALSTLIKDILLYLSS